jgi:hypothetical protein
MVYLTVLSVCMLVTVIGIGALLVTRQQRLAVEANDDLDEARDAARSGIDLARYIIASDSSWRTTHSNGTWQTSKFKGQLVTIAVTDPADANLSNCLSDPVLVTATGVSGSATQIMQATLAADLKPLSCLAAALTVNGALTVKGNGISSDGLVSCATTISGDGPLNANAEANLITDLNGSGSRAILSAGRAVPAATVFDYYKTFGTPIDYNTINGDIKGVTLSPTSNPWGTPNARGIYVVDCGARTFTLEGCTINGTLVILNCKANSQVKGSPILNGLTPNQPTLLVQGSITINIDQYPQVLNGPIYVSGSLAVGPNATVADPIIVGGDCTITGGLTLSYDPSAYNNPPEGFYQLPANMKLATGTWKPATN